jgi:cytochrome b
MAYALWATRGLVVATGIAIADHSAIRDSRGQGKASVAKQSLREEWNEDAGETKGREGGEDLLAEAHEGGANLLYVFIVLHIAGVMFETRRSGRNLVREMLPDPR